MVTKVSAPESFVWVLADHEDYPPDETADWKEVAGIAAKLYTSH